MDVAARPDLVFLRGEGDWMWDDRGPFARQFARLWRFVTLRGAGAPYRTGPCRIAVRAADNMHVQLTDYISERAGEYERHADGKSTVIFVFNKIY